MSLNQEDKDDGLNAVDNILSHAVSHHQNGNWQDAENLYHDILKIDANHLSALYRLGVLYFQNDKAEQARPFLEKARALQPQNPNILSTLGVVSQIIGHDADAIAYLQQALAVRPDDAGILTKLGKALLEQRDNEGALACFIKADQATPHNPDIQIKIGRCHYEMGHFSEAKSCFEKALTQQPNSTDALSALSSVAWAIGNRNEARFYLERALEIEPHNEKIILNTGEFLAFDEGKIDEAIGYFDRALAINPIYTNAQWRKSFALLARGDYREGWKLYADCLGHRDTRGLNKFAPQKPWDGTPAPNAHLLIWCEQGLGDSLHFIRYAGLCKQRVGKISVFCQKPLVSLFKNLPYIDDASDICDTGSFDEHVPIMNLPHLFDTQVETIPNAPYLSFLSPPITAKWATKFGNTNHKLKVGLVWAGGAHEENINAKLTDQQRSLSLDKIKTWLDIEDIEFYSLQKDKPAEQIKTLGLQNRIINLMDDVTDFIDTAAIIMNLDLVITVDTSVAHLAGGLGKPVWIMSRYNADWRWLQNRPDSPWYPAARIFGQPTTGDWQSVISKITQELKLEITKHNDAMLSENTK